MSDPYPASLRTWLARAADDATGGRFGRLRETLATLVKEMVRHDDEIERLKASEAELRDRLRYVETQARELRAIVRDLAGDLNSLPYFQTASTRESFEYQWRELPESKDMLSDPTFRARVGELLCENTGLPPEWFAGKRVLDVGCGQGRWSYGLCKLGAQVVAIDGSASGVERTRAACDEVGGAEVLQRDLLEDLTLEPTFDLVHAFGCLHHTGNTRYAFDNVAKLVRPGGYLFLMVYVEPEEWGAYRYYNEVDRLHRALRNLSSAERVAYLKEHLPPGESLHMWFDAASPAIKERYEPSEVEGWFEAAGFEGVTRTKPENLFLVGRKRTGGSKVDA